MAVEKGINPFSFEANADLSTKQFRAMAQNATTGNVDVPAATTTFALGILQNKPGAAGRGASIQSLAGTVTKAYLRTTVAGSGIGIGAELVAQATGYLGINTTGGLNYVLARALAAQATSTAGIAISSVMITHEGLNSSA